VVPDPTARARLHGAVPQLQHLEAFMSEKQSTCANCGARVIEAQSPTAKPVLVDAQQDMLGVIALETIEGEPPRAVHWKLNTHSGQPRYMRHQCTRRGGCDE
jgi:hypothetical protein